MSDHGSAHFGSMARRSSLTLPEARPTVKPLAPEEGSTMMSRRGFMGAVGTGAVASALAQAQHAKPARKRLAVVTTEWRYHSHAWHMAERFLAGYPMKGKWHQPPIEVV